MNEIDTKKIKKMTNNLIAYDNYEKERKMKKKKIKQITFTFLALFVVIGGTITVDAATDNAISNLVKDALTVKVNGQDKNANCEKLSNGNYKCTIDKEVTGNDSEVIVEYNKDLLKNDIDLKYDSKAEGDEVSININDVQTN